MRNYITINGKNSNEINGLLIQELPPISKPQIRTEVEEIDGRDGDIVTKLGFAAYDKEFTVGLYKDFDINEIIAYFNSEGTVVFSNESDKCYNYQIIDQIDFERLVRYRTATVRMHCQPFKYSNTEGARTLGNKGTASGEGSFITLDNTSEAQFSKIDPKGNATQTTYSGKNLFDISKVLTNGTQLINNGDGTLTVNTTSSSSSARGADPATLADYCPTLAVGDTVTLSATSTGSNKFIYLGVPYSNTWAFGTTLTITQDMLDAKVFFYASGLSTTAKISNIQIELGSTATDYEPFVGGTPAPNPSYPQPISVVTGENVVKVVGKNLMPQFADGSISMAQTMTAGSLTVQQFYTTYPGVLAASEGVLSGSISNATTIWNNTFSGLTPNTTYTISLDYKVNLTQSGNYFILSKFITNQPAGESSGRVSRTFTTDENGDFINSSVTQGLCYFYNYTTSFELSNIQLELGSTATAYEPYQGQDFEINLGKNLFNKSTVTAGYRIGSDGSPFADSSFFLSDYIRVNASAVYAYSRAGSGSNSSAIAFYKSDKTFISRTMPIIANSATSGTVTSPAEAYYARICDTNANLDSAQLELGTQATAYAPYFTPIELAGVGEIQPDGLPKYRDSFKKTDGKWYIEKQVGKYTFTSADESGFIWSTDRNRIYMSPEQLASRGINAQYPSASATVLDGYSDKFTVTSFAIGYGADSLGGYLFISSSGTLSLRYTSWTSRADAIADMNNTTFYYALATPTTTEITNETLIAQLEALYNQAHAYKGRTHVAAIAQGSNAPHIIEAEVQRSSDGNITNNGNIVSKPTLTIYGSGNIGVSLNGYQILEVTLGDEEYITIDTAAMEAYKDTLDNLKNRLVNGDYSKFALRPGSNMIEFSGTVSKCVISKYSRWL